MAKTAKNAMKVKTGLKTYTCNWAFKTPVESWSKETLVANIRAGIRYAIARKITLSVQADEQNTGRNKAMIQFMTSQTGGDPEKLALMNEFCVLQGIKTEIQTDFIFSESDFAVVEDETTEDDETDDETTEEK